MPYSREYNTYRQKVGKQAQDNTELQIEYEKILERVRQTKASVIRMGHRHFTAPVEEIDGTVDSVSPGGLTLKEYPGRKFQFSSVGTSAADMTARIIGKQNKRTRADAAKEVDRRRGELRQYLADNLSGESVRLVIPKGASENAENIRAVVMAGGTNINQVLLSRRTTIGRRTANQLPRQQRPRSAMSCPPCSPKRSAMGGHHKTRSPQSGRQRSGCATRISLHQKNCRGCLRLSRQRSAQWSSSMPPRD